MSYKQRDAASYDEAAVEYDRLTERFVTPIAIKMLDLAMVKPHHRVLDVGTGTGVVALKVAPLLVEGQVIGIDHSPGMLARASEKARHLESHNIVSFQKMDAEHLDFPDKSFDVVLSLYALLHFPEPMVALRMMHRVLKHGGRAVIGTGMGPSLFSIDGFVQGISRMVNFVAIGNGRLLTAPMFLRSVLRAHGIGTSETEEFNRSRPNIGRMLRRAGFVDISNHEQHYREELNPEEFWKVQAIYSTPERILLQGITAPKIAALKQDFLEQCQRVQSKKGKLIYPYGATFHTAFRP